MKSFFKPGEVSVVTGISYRQIGYWDKARFIIPSYRVRDKFRLYTFCDLCLIYFARVLRDSGVSIQKLRRIIANTKALLKEIKFPLVDVGLHYSGKDLFLSEGKILINSDSLKGCVSLYLRDVLDKVKSLFPEDVEEKENTKELTSRQKSILVDLARVGITQGLYDLREWVSSYERYCGLAFSSNPEAAYLEMLSAVADLLSETAPDYKATAEEVLRIVKDHYDSCRYPGCSSRGKFPADGSGIWLCEKHEGCVLKS